MASIKPQHLVATPIKIARFLKKSLKRVAGKIKVVYSGAERLRRNTYQGGTDMAHATPLAPMLENPVMNGLIDENRELRIQLRDLREELAILTGYHGVDGAVPITKILPLLDLDDKREGGDES